MRLFSKKTDAAPECAYDQSREKPVIRASICTGERVAGFKELKTGRFREVTLIRGQKDIDSFMKRYGLDRVDTEY